MAVEQALVGSGNFGREAVMAARSRVGGFAAVLALALVAGAAYCIRLDVPGYYDNEGRYAEVAREMLLSGDFVTPTLDFFLFLNKPPLTFWLTALVFDLGGTLEWGRLVPVGWAVVTLVATCRLGTVLYGRAVGLVAGVVLATMIGFVLEARTLRPDMGITAAVVIAVLCWWRSRLPGARQTAWLVGLYTALGVGVLGKGFVTLVLAAIPILAVTLRDDGWAGLRRLRPGLGMLVGGAIVVPWHVAVAFEHPGFAWDYVVNQHLLFFFDKKFPKDGPGDPLGFFWGAYAARMTPWILLLPPTLAEALRGLRRKATPEARGTLLLWIWTAGVLLFFSLAPSRLEHYTIPVLPAGALLVARFIGRAGEGSLGRGHWAALVVVGGALVLAGLVGIVAGPGLVGQTYWIADTPTMPPLARWTGAIVLLMGAGLVAGARRRRASLVLAAVAVTAVPLAAVVVRAQVAAERLFSWRPAAEVLRTRTAPGTEFVFEAPQEYQLVAGLAFYTQRRITLLEPPGFIPPTYLEEELAGMFLPRDEFTRRWQANERLALVSSPIGRRDTPEGLVPGPFEVLERFGDRWVLATESAAR